MQVKLILGWLYVGILCFIYGLLLAAYGLVLFQIPHDPRLSFFYFLFLALFAAFIGCCFGVQKFCRIRKLDSRGYWRFALLVLLTIPIACLMHDAAPIEHDYSMKDIVSGDPKILESYDTLMLFRKDGGMKIETDTSSNYPQFQTNLHANFLTNILAYSESISNAWNSIAAARSVIDKLDTYPGITDMTPQVQLGTNTPIPNFMTLRSISWTYAAYATLKTAEGLPEEGVEQLLKIQSVTRKALPCSLLLVDKMVWSAIARNNIEAAFAILQQSQYTRENLEILKEAFQPISEADISLRRVFIKEYMGFKGICEIELRPGNFLELFVFAREGETLTDPPLFRKAISPLVYYLTFRKNRTIRDLRKYFDLLIEDAGKHSMDMSNDDTYIINYLQNPDIRNLGGWYLVSIAVPSFSRCYVTTANTKILSDLLAIEIGDRLKQPVVLNDYYSGGPYGRDELTGRPFSVGPDKKPNTDDDIYLGKQ